ncbi:MAG: GtrA family protein [Lachnospiraceae bacterium]|nr:GtrA family protein [Lachnospiraceae bacterium]
MNGKKDIFDKIMSLPILNHWMEPYKKYKEILLYLFFGGLTSVVSIVSYAYCDVIMGMNPLIANVISWILAVTFAYITNKIWVFQVEIHGKKELLQQMVSFYTGRLLTLGIEEVILFIFITKCGFNSLVVKIVAQVVVVVSNYIISKCFVFRDKK